VFFGTLSPSASRVALCELIAQTTPNFEVAAAAARIMDYTSMEDVRDAAAAALISLSATFVCFGFLCAVNFHMCGCCGIRTVF
jgi:hypothetical protein